MQETAYTHLPAGHSHIAHHYGAQVRLSACPVQLSRLARLSSLSTQQPEITDLVRALYLSLAQQAIGDCFPKAAAAIETRMHPSTPDGRGIWHGDVLDRRQKAVAVDIARAGTLPAQVTYELLNTLMDPQLVRQDHIYMNRVTNEQGTVTGVDVTGSKIGGDVADSIVLIPDPMGATGGSMARTIAMYKALAGGAPRRIIALHLIVTPEYLTTLVTQHADVVVYAIRLDRGMSPPDIMASGLGARWQDEKGLNEQQYIIPGAGGLGEILNNSYV